MSIVPTVSTKAAGGNIQATNTFTTAVEVVANTIFSLLLQWNPRIAAAAEIIIPTAESWMLTDCYYNLIGDTVNMNPQIEVKKDNDRLLDTTKLGSSIIVTSAQRPNGLNGNLVFEGGSHMTMNGVSTITVTPAAPNNILTAIFPYEKQG